MEKNQANPGSAAPTTLGFLIAVLLIVSAFPSIAVGQKDTGGIAGIVRDSGGAVVSGVKVMVTDVDRGTELAITTDMQGEYVVNPLKIGASLGDVLNGSAYVIQPSVDAIAEFKVQTNAYSAEFSHEDFQLSRSEVIGSRGRDDCRVAHRDMRLFFR